MVMGANNVTPTAALQLNDTYQHVIETTSTGKKSLSSFNRMLTMSISCKIVASLAFFNESLS